ncbi:MAG: hypothetical protein CVV18_02705 [Gammaproteobacteria bacterium HGW-Gammaproteobacteria-8]|nr:MAG: hypothetical protein CVV18_02705 [Gammaproteobacteria bacterium HGW-Gammaproteobacteria-8]
MRCERFEVPYRIYGSSENTLVCVSGAMQTMSIWRSVVKRFTDDYTVVLFDMPGVGRSRVLSGTAHVTVDEQIQVLDSLIASLISETRGPGELVLAGSSWGTAIAASYAALKPDVVDSLLLSSFGMRPNAGMEYVVERATALYHARDYAGGAELIFEVFGRNLGPVYKQQIMAQFQNLTSDSAEIFYQHCANILSLGRLDEAVDLTRITARTLIINGADDPIIDLDDMRLAETLIPDCQLRLVDKVGHFLHFEKPELLEEYADFLLAGRGTGDAAPDRATAVA